MIVTYFIFQAVRPTHYGSHLAGIRPPERACEIVSLPSECVWIVPGTLDVEGRPNV